MNSIIMNKFMVTVLAFLTVADVVNCDRESSEKFLEHVKSSVKSKHLKSILKDRKEIIEISLSKIEEQCPEITQKLKDALKSFGECDETVDDSLTVCASIQKYSLNCTRPILQVIDDCLPQKSKGLPILIMKSVLSLLDYLCKLDGQSLFELLNPCLWEHPDTSIAELDECEKKVFSKFDKFKKKTPSTQEICTIRSDLKCMQEQVGPNCKSAKTKNIAIGVFDALLRPCALTKIEE